MESWLQIWVLNEDMVSVELMITVEMSCGAKDSWIIHTSIDISCLFCMYLLYLLEFRSL